MNKFLLVIALVGSVGFIGKKGFNDWFQLPEHFPTAVYQAEHNPLSEGKIQLGRMLFYDPILSRDSTVSCASCHSPFNAFAHTDHPLSHGIDDQIGIRNAPPIFNLAWKKNLMWDGAINHLEVQALAPLENPIEMGEKLSNVLVKLNRSPRYSDLFEQAFGGSPITGEYFLKAMAQFQVSLVSATSRYDSVRSGHASFTEMEQKGYALFQQHCNSCHTEPLFTRPGFEANGISVDSVLNDEGYGAVTQNPDDQYLFQIPSLRNLTYTFPYMHDGRFRRLREVINHYAEGTGEHGRVTGSLSLPLSLEPRQKSELLAFLLTLNDPDFVMNPDHRFPMELVKPYVPNP